MSKFKKSLAKVLVLCITLSYVLTAGSTSVAAKSVPGINSKVTTSNVTAVLNKYDPIGAKMVKLAKNEGDITRWWQNKGKGKLLTDIDSCVHESTHEYIYNAGNDRMTIYLPYSKKNIGINWSSSGLICTREAAQNIPTKFRGFRFGTYIYTNENMAANIHGIYGMFNEFTAYGNGLNNNLAMYKYALDQKKSKSAARAYVINGVDNNIEAYSEFKYYMISYMVHVKKYYPGLYASILENKSFIKAYGEINKLWEQNIKKAIKLFGSKVDTSFYKSVNNELKKSKYKDVINGLNGKTVKRPKDDGKYCYIDNSYCNNGKIYLSWQASDYKLTYKVYRKSGKGSYKLVKEISDRISDNGEYYDKAKFVDGTTYTYKVVAYRDGQKFKESVPWKIFYLSSAKLKSAKYKSGNINITWQKAKKVSYYEIEITQQIGPMSFSTIGYTAKKGTTKGSYNVYGFARGEVKVKVRAVYKHDKIIDYSPWSPAKTVIIK